MKILSIAVPCYNSAAYMRKCIDSLLVGGEDVEIIIVNDGSSKDNTKEIADEYVKKYPSICKAIHKENGGHGDAVMHGLKLAGAKYFKVVDSDDWVDESAYLKILETLKNLEKEEIDMFISNYVYEKEGRVNKKIVSYRDVMPKDKIFTWDEVGRFLPGKYILMHSVIYRRELLIKSKMEMPKHTFYVDNIFVYQPLPFVKKMYYLDLDFYRYFIGRDDQSVNETVMIGRIDQQLKVTKLMLSYYDPYRIRNKKLRHYMMRYLEIMMVISSILAIKSGSKENMLKKKEIWEYLKLENPRLYRKLRLGLLGLVMNLPGKLGRKITIFAYEISRKIYSFN